MWKIWKFIQFEFLLLFWVNCEFEFDRTVLDRFVWFLWNLVYVTSGGGAVKAKWLVIEFLACRMNVSKLLISLNWQWPRWQKKILVAYQKFLLSHFHSKTILNPFSFVISLSWIICHPSQKKLYAMVSQKIRRKCLNLINIYY